VTDAYDRELAIVERVSTTTTIPAYKLQVKIDTDKGAEVEPNDTQPTANGLPSSDVYIFGSHQVATNNDLFAIQVPAGKSIRAEIIEGNSGTCESNGVDSRTGGTAAVNTFARNLPGGTYYLRVESSDPVAPHGGRSLRLPSTVIVR